MSPYQESLWLTYFRQHIILILPTQKDTNALQFKQYDYSFLIFYFNLFYFVFFRPLRTSLANRDKYAMNVYSYSKLCNFKLQAFLRTRNLERVSGIK